MKYNQYPTDERGLVIPTSEYFTPHPHRPNFINNHHMWFPAKKATWFVMLQTVRDLAVFQEQIPISTHEWAHGEFDDPVIPKINTLMDRLDEAYMIGEKLRYGSAKCFVLKDIGADIWGMVQTEYTDLRRLVL